MLTVNGHDWLDDYEHAECSRRWPEMIQIAACLFAKILQGLTRLLLLVETHELALKRIDRPMKLRLSLGRVCCELDTHIVLNYAHLR